MSKKSYTILGFLLGVIFTVVGTKVLDHYYVKYFESKKIYYELLHTSQISIRDAQLYAKAETIDSFNVNLDDPFMGLRVIVWVNSYRLEHTSQYLEA